MANPHIEDTAHHEGESCSSSSSRSELSDLEEPLSALAPEPYSQQECPSHTSTSPALQCLEELFSAGKISGDKVARLKASFNLLHDTLRRTKASELNLLQKAKCFRAELEIQHQELEKLELFPEGEDTEVVTMRQQLLQLNNKLREAEDIEYQMQYQLDFLQEEKDYLEKEYESQPKTEDQEKQILTLKESCEDMKKEIAQWQQEFRSLTEDLETCNKQILREQQELEDLKETIKSEEAIQAQLFSVPAQLLKETDGINRIKVDVEKCKAEIEKQVQDETELKERTQAHCKKLEEECRAALRERDSHNAHLEAALRKHSILFTEKEMTKEKEAVLLEKRGLLDVAMKHIMAERKTLHERLSQMVREKDKLLQGLKKKELQFKMAKDSLLFDQELYTTTKSKNKSMPKDEDADQKIMDLQKEVDELKLKLIYGQSATEHETNQVKLCIEEEHALIKKSNRLRKDLQHLYRLTLIHADERNKKSRELLKAQMRYNHSKQDVQGKQLQILEHKKQHQEIGSRLTEYVKLYDAIKEERNNFAYLIQGTSQRLVEMKEDSKRLKNELDILHTAVVNKDRLLQKSRLKCVQNQMVRDSLKKDISREARSLQDMQGKREQQREELDNLAQAINIKEQQLLHLRESHDTSIQSRKKLGVQLLEREQELCAYYEKVKAQESLIQKRAVMIQTLEEDIRTLRICISEEKSQVSLRKKQMLFKRALEEESTLLQIQMSECKDRMLYLENAYKEKAMGKVLCELSGEDASPAELVKKIKQLERQLAEKEAQLLEKGLVYEQVTRMSEQMQAKAVHRKEDTLKLAKKVNKCQSRIKDSTKKLMAVVSALAMRQAQALHLQQELRQREMELDSCHLRLAQGLPPSDIIEQEWQRHLKHQQLREADAKERAQMEEEEEWSQLPNGVFTTAESRPNAYIPEDGSLPLPKPYGALAPFKPTEPGTNMRHIRKPQIKPIEI